jgi:hypothetical protein
MTSHVTGPGGTNFDDHDDLRIPRIVITDQEMPRTLDGQILQTVSVHQRSEGPPKLELRGSFRDSFTRGSMFSLGRFRIPE